MYGGKSASKVSSLFYLEYKQVTVCNTCVRYRKMCSLHCNSHYICWDTCHSGSSVKALVVKWLILQMQPLPEPHFDIFINLEAQTLESNASFWGTGGNPMVPNQDYGEGEEKSPTARCSRGSLWEPGHFHAILPHHRLSSQWLPTNSCILDRKNELQFTLLPLSTLSVWSPLFNWCWTRVFCLHWWTGLPPGSRNIILTYNRVPQSNESITCMVIKQGTLLSGFPLI